MTFKYPVILIFCSSCAAFQMANQEITSINEKNSINDMGTETYRDHVLSPKSSIDHLAQLEARLSDEEFDEYQSLSSHFRNNSQRIEFLSVQSVEARDSWLQEHGIHHHQDRYPSQIQAAIYKRDIVYGMSKDAVIKSWGEPSKIEYAGRGGYERWTYYSNPALKEGRKFLFFESGSLSAWESN